MFPVVMAMVLFGAVLALGVYMFRWQQRKGEAVLNGWAARERLQLLEVEPANPIGTGPMNRNASDKRIVYRVKVEDQAGRVRWGTVRVGLPGSGVLSDKVSVEWDP